jgi:NADPH:quinone reductase
VGDRRVSFDLLDFYHNESQLFGVDTGKRDAIGSGALLEALTPGFEQGAFKAPSIDRIIPLAEGPAAYEQVARGDAKGQLVLVPGGRERGRRSGGAGSALNLFEPQ